MSLVLLLVAVFLWLVSVCLWIAVGGVVGQQRSKNVIINIAIIINNTVYELILEGHLYQGRLLADIIIGGGAFSCTRACCFPVCLVFNLALLSFRQGNTPFPPSSRTFKEPSRLEMELAS